MILLAAAIYLHAVWSVDATYLQREQRTLTGAWGDGVTYMASDVCSSTIGGLSCSILGQPNLHYREQACKLDRALLPVCSPWFEEPLVYCAVVAGAPATGGCPTDIFPTEGQ